MRSTSSKARRAHSAGRLSRRVKRVLDRVRMGQNNQSRPPKATSNRPGAKCLSQPEEAFQAVTPLDLTHASMQLCDVPSCSGAVAKKVGPKHALPARRVSEDPQGMPLAYGDSFRFKAPHPPCAERLSREAPARRPFVTKSAPWPR